MRFLLFSLLCTFSWSSQLPLSLVVEKLETRFNCSVDFSLDLKNRKTVQKPWTSLNKALASIFYKESFSITEKNGNKVVKIFKKSLSPLGDLASRKVYKKEITENGKNVEIDSSSFLLSFDEGLSEQSKQSILDSYSLKYDASSLNFKTILVGVNPSKFTEVAKKLSSDDRLKSSYNYMVKTAGSVDNIGVNLAEINLSDPFYGKQWGHKVVKGHVGYLDTKVFNPKVIVLDTGINLSHPDLSSENISNRSFQDELLVDNDTNGHGTAVTGIIGAAWNGVGVTGLTKADVISIKVFDH